MIRVTVWNEYKHEMECIGRSAAFLRSIDKTEKIV